MRIETLSHQEVTEYGNIRRSLSLNVMLMLRNVGVEAKNQMEESVGGGVDKEKRVFTTHGKG